MSLALVDLSSLARMYHAMQSATDPAHQAATQTAAKVRGFAKDHEHVIVCLDMPPYLRRELSADYKSKRPDAQEGYSAQLAACIAELRADGFPVVGVQGHEADDVIATLVRQAEDVEVVVVSSDKDLLCLTHGGVEGPADYGHQVRQLSPRTGALMGPAEVEAKFGVPPDGMHDWLCLVGDSSDTIEGVAGVGEKTATALLQKHGSLAAIIGLAEDPDSSLTPKLRESILTAARSGTLALASQLIRLRSGLPIKLADYLVERVSKPRIPAPAFEGKDTTVDHVEPTVTDTPTEHSAELVTTQPDAPAVFDATQQPRAALQAPGWGHSLEPGSLRDALALARHLHNSRLYTHLPNPEAIFAGILIARSHGVETPKMLAPGVLHVINGRMTMSAQLMAALVLKSGHAEYFAMVESTPEKATFATKRKGAPKEVVFTYTIEEARQAGLKWAQPNATGNIRPRTMLRHRCEAELARAVYQDVVLGMMSPEELQE